MAKRKNTTKKTETVGSAGRSHTRGPWDGSHGVMKPDGAGRKAIGYYLPVFAKNTAGGIETVAIVHGTSEEQILANGLLIAAAPQLLDACEKAMSYFNTLVNKNPNDVQLYSKVQEFWHAASHAVVRATSEAYAELNDEDGNEKARR